MNDSHSGSKTTTPSTTTPPSVTPTPSTTTPSAVAAGERSGAVRPVLWVLLVVCAAGDAVASRADAGVGVRVAFWLATLGCAAALIVHHYRRRRG
ncbi:hypothetical protein [Actinomadura sp. 9N215]|uniref:hypothetical protein n=1 Tax=Actinomadura sp. 9N215 TaxID=3375150 RepID=UPI0037B7C4BE